MRTLQSESDDTAPPGLTSPPADSAPARVRRRRVVLGWVATVLAVVVVWTALVLPDRILKLEPAVLLRIPIEALVLVGLALVLPSRRVRIVAAVLGLLVGVLTVVRILDLGFHEVVHRSFNPVGDWKLIGPGLVAFRDTAGAAWGNAAIAGAIVLPLLILLVLTLSVVRLSTAARRHRRAAARGLAALAALWLVTALLGTQIVPGVPVAARGASELAVAQVRDGAANLHDLPVFRAELAKADPFAQTPADQLLARLHGKDVVLVFVESYGKVALEDPAIAPGVRAVLDDGARSLQQDGFSARSAWLTSSTFGGVSWLAHATVQSGLWVDSQQRHDQLFDSDRMTLSRAFARAGWRTVIDTPSNRDPWPEGRRFYGVDRTYDRYDVGYEGPKFGFAAMPDQYSLASFERLELAAGHDPVMAEIDLVSSHEPWTPLPRMVGWDQLGDGSVFDGMPAQGQAASDVLGDRDRLRRLYGSSVEYSLDALLSWVTTYHQKDDDLVLVFLGDHQPAETVSGGDATHDVPITVVARDPAVMEQIAPWGWDEGVQPGPDAPVWRMDAFRDRFLTAYTPPN